MHKWVKKKYIDWALDFNQNIIDNMPEDAHKKGAYKIQKALRFQRMQLEGRR